MSASLGILIDGVVVAGDSASQRQTFAEGYNPAYVGEVRVEVKATGATALVNYDNFELGDPAAPRFFEMVREHERHLLSSAYCSTDAFRRRELARAFAQARLSPQMHPSFEAAAHALRGG